jgi:glutathionylspermidine synthase
VKTQFASAKQMLNSLWQMYKNTEKMFDAQIKSMEAKVAQAKA